MSGNFLNFYKTFEVICGSHENVACRSTPIERLIKSPTHYNRKFIAMFLPRSHFPRAAPNQWQCGRATKADPFREDSELLKGFWPCPNFIKLYCSLGKFYPTFPPLLLHKTLNLHHSLLTLPVFSDISPISFPTGASLIKFFHILPCLLTGSWRKQINTPCYCQTEM